MNTPRHPDAVDPVDARITALIGAAVAATPTPPDLEGMTMGANGNLTHRPTNRWVVGGAVGLAAAGLIAVLVVTDRGGDAVVIQTPADSGVVDRTPDTSVAPAPPPIATRALPAGTVLTAGSNGIASTVAAGTVTVLGGTPTDIAIEGPDGRIYSQPTVVGPNATVESIDATGGDPTTIALPVAGDVALQLTDVASVDGELTLLYVVSARQCTAPDAPTCVTSVRAFRPATEVETVVAEFNAWEGGWNAVSLADNGLIAGAFQESAVETPQFYSLTRTPAPTAVSLGLDDGYGDCDDCPTSFTVDASGRIFAWIDGTPDDPRLIVTDAMATVRADIPIAVSGPANSFKPLQGVLQISGIEFGGSGQVLRGTAVFTPRSADGPVTPIRIDLATNVATELQPGSVATIR